MAFSVSKFEGKAQKMEERISGEEREEERMEGKEKEEMRMRGGS